MKAIEKAIKKLKDNGWIIEKHPAGYFCFWSGTAFHDTTKDDCYSERELIVFAKKVIPRPGNKSIKMLTNRPIRRKINQKLVKEDFDSITPEKRNKKNNPWYYD